MYTRNESDGIESIEANIADFGLKHKNNRSRRQNFRTDIKVHTKLKNLIPGADDYEQTPLFGKGH
jgi:hypothetical protein